MRIVFFSNTYRPTVSGVITSIDAFRHGLTAAGHQVHTIVPEANNYIDTEPYIYRLPSVDLPGDFQFSLTLPAHARLSFLLEGIKPHLIHCQHPFLTGDMAAQLASELDVPLVYTFHSRYDILTQRYIPMSVFADLAGYVVDDYLSNFFEKCHLILAPTPSIKAYIDDHFHPNAAVEVLPTPINTRAVCSSHRVEGFREVYGLQRKEVLVYIGRLAKEKNLDFLLRVFSTLRKSRPSVHLLMVGDGAYRDKLEDMITDLRLQDAVTITGFMPSSDVTCHAALGKLFVFPSDSETQGLVLLEAMSAGLPVVAAHAPGCSDVLMHGGGVLTPLDEEQFVSAILMLLENPERMRQLSLEARQVAGAYDIAPISVRLAELYERTIADYMLNQEPTY